MGRGHINIPINIHTLRLTDQLGPEGRVGEEEKNIYIYICWLQFFSNTLNQTWLGTSELQKKLGILL